MKYKIGDCTFFLICDLIDAIEKLDQIIPNDLEDSPNAIDDTNEARWTLINCIASVVIGDYIDSMKQIGSMKQNEGKAE